MKILDIKKDNVKFPIQFDRETIIVMAFVNKIIVFENGAEMHTFKSLFEDMQDYWENNNEEQYDKYCDALYWYVDPFEEESFMVDHKKNEEYTYEGRKLLVESTNDFTNFDDNISIYFGVLNSKDMYFGMNELQKTVDIIETYLNISEFTKTLDLKELSMLTNILEIFKEDIEESKVNPNNYFGVIIRE